MSLTEKQKKAIKIAVGAKSGDSSVSEAIAGASDAASVALIAVADATDLATAVTLVNACKAKINELLNALK